MTDQQHDRMAALTVLLKSLLEEKTLIFLSYNKSNLPESHPHLTCLDHFACKVSTIVNTWTSSQHLAGISLVQTPFKGKKNPINLL